MHYHQQEIETDLARREASVYLTAICRRFQRIEEIIGYPQVFHAPSLAYKAFRLNRFADVRLIYRLVLAQHADLVTA